MSEGAWMDRAYPGRRKKTLVIIMSATCLWTSTHLLCTLLCLWGAVCLDADSY